MTSKVKTVKYAGVVQQVQKTTLNGTTTTNRYQALVDTSWLDSSDGVDNPKWKDQVRKHLNATTPYSASKAKIEVQFGQSLIAEQVVPDFDISDEQRGWLIQNFQQPDPGPTGDLLNATYLAFVRKANKELRSVQGMQFLGELREAIHMVRHPLETLKNEMGNYLIDAHLNARKAVRDHARARRPARSPRLGRDIDSDLRDRGVLTLRQRKPETVDNRVRTAQRTRAQVVSKSISGTYLEYANGWRPLVNDIISASKALAEHFNPSGIGYRRVSVTVAGVETSEVTQQLGSFSSPFTWYQTDVIKRNCSGRMVGEVVVNNSGDSKALLRNAGLELRNFAPTVWELLPLSYVADYFVNMGETLEAAAFNRGSVAWWSRTIRATAESIATGQIIKPSPGVKYYSYSGNPGRVTFKRTSIQRDAVQDWMPSLTFSLPGSHLLSKLANVTSLLAQARSSSRQISRLLNG
jgi:hypothetical protein